MSNLMLSICVITYNQKEFIAQTLNSILTQEHDYSYEIIIGDDCSTDGTQEIIKKYESQYPDIIKPLYNQKNIGVIDNYFNVINHCFGKYIMECAGDDWWLPEKIASQISYMENNPNVGMIYGKARIWNENNNTYSRFQLGSNCGGTRDLLLQNPIPAVTVCFRRKLIYEYINEINPCAKDWKMEDYPFWIYCSYKSNIQFINDTIAVYRQIDNSISHQKNLDKKFIFYKSVEEIKEYYRKRYNFTNPIMTDNDIWFYIYVNALKEKYDKQLAIKLRYYYLKLEKINSKQRIYYIFSSVKFFWFLIKILKS